MSVKQDRSGVRTAVDLERKYNFGKTFAEMLGLINDSRDKVDSVESSLRSEFEESMTTLRRDTESIAMSAARTVTETLEGDVRRLEESFAEFEIEADEINASVSSRLQTVEDDIESVSESVAEFEIETASMIASVTNRVQTVEEDLQTLEETVSEIKLDEDGIIASVSNRLQTMENNLDSIGNDVSTLESDVSTLEESVELKMTANEVNIAIENRIAKGVSVDSVTTRTGYRFDSEGLQITKSGTEIATKIDNTGMTVLRGEEEMLKANNEGVNAMNLHAKTYLIIGTGDGRSRFEDYLDDRTGCFWIGG